MDSEYGRRIRDHFKNDLAPDEVEDEKHKSIYEDPRALFESVGAGEPGGLPMPTFLDARDVISKSRMMSDNIFQSWKLLRTIIERHEATIQKRWLKRNKEQRKRILTHAWPGMATSHRPDFKAFKRSTQPQVTQRDAYMWPYVNIDDLSKPRLFLLLLNSRARNQPYEFARADMNACRFGITSRALVPGFLNGHVVMFTGRCDAKSYGELIAWDDHPDAFDWMHQQRGAHPGEGLMILEIQQRLYAFLVSCCEDILCDMSEELQHGPETPVKPEPPSVAAGEDALTSLATAAAEAPYRLPANLDLHRLESIMEAKLLAAEDHVWGLREDPGYFATTLLEYKEHRQESVLDSQRKQHPLLANSKQTTQLWERVIKNSTISALAEVEIWSALYEQLKQLRRLQSKYASRIDPELDLPQEYALAFYTLVHCLHQFSKGPIGNLKVGLFASPPMRPYFERMPQDPQNTIIRIQRKYSLPKDSIRDELMWIAGTLFDEQQLHLVGLNTLMDELERLQEAEPKAKELISAWVADKIADLSVMSHCLHQIELYQPWAATFESEMVEHEDSISEKHMNIQKSFETYFQTDIGTSLASIGAPTEARFRYPVDKRRTCDNVEAMRSAESNLDRFWERLDQKLQKAYASSPRVRALLSERILQRTPRWSEPVKSDASITATGDGDGLNQPLSELHFNLQHLTERTIDRSTPTKAKVKQKTRGTALEHAPLESELESSSQSDSPPKFRLDKRALKVFKTLFFTPSASSQPGEVAWHDFLHALTCTGFAAEKLYGSVWQFTPTRMDVERSIQFHEPHPTGKIPFVIARRHGRRLNRAYGWHSSMFELAT